MLPVAALLLNFRPGQKVQAHRVFAVLRPSLRGQVLVMYCFAALAKLNSGFWDPDRSAAVAMANHTLTTLGVGPAADWMGRPLIASVVVVECLLPLALFFVKTRRWALVGGMLFHGGMAVAGHIPFSGFACALLWLFAPADLPERIREVLQRSAITRLARRRLQELFSFPWTALVLGLLYLGASTIYTLGWVDAEVFKSAAHRVSLCLFMAYSAVLIALLVLGLRSSPSPTCGSRGLCPAFRLLWLGPILVVANALCPYLGLKTESSFTMYSNLKTEGQHWNHFLFPRSMRVFGYQDEVLRIIDSSDQKLLQDREEGTGWIRFELRRYLADRPDTMLSYEVGGELFHVERAGEHPEFSAAPSRWLSKWMWFRPVFRPGQQKVAH